MKKTFLFPTYFRKIGWIISIVTLLYFVIGGIFFPGNYDFNFKMPAIVAYGNIPFYSQETKYFVLSITSFNTTLFPAFMIIGLIFIAFSREKNEDEYVSKIREQSLVWSVLVTCLIVIFAILFIYGMAAIYVFWLDFLLFLLVFVIKFRVEIFRFKRSIKRDEE